MHTRQGRASHDRRPSPGGSCGRRGHCQALPQPRPGFAREEMLWVEAEGGEEGRSPEPGS